MRWRGTGWGELRWKAGSLELWVIQVWLYILSGRTVEEWQESQEGEEELMYQRALSDDRARVSLHRCSFVVGDW